MADFNNNQNRNQRPNFNPAVNPNRNNTPHNGISRRQKVENFVVNIDENHHHEKKVDTSSNRPKAKGEVYFANYQRSAGDTSVKRYTGGANNQQRQRPRTPGDVSMNKNSNPNASVNMFQNTGKNAPSKTNSKRKKKRLSSEDLLKLKKAYSRTMIISMICVLIFTIVFSVVGIDCINDALALSVTDEEIEVVVPEKITTSEAIDLFHEKGLIKVPWFSKFFASFRGYDEEGINYYVNGEKRVKAYMGGTYYLSREMGVEGMLNILLDNSATSEQTVSITFPEGYTTAQIVNRLEDYEILTNANKFVGAASYDYQYDFLKGTSKGVAIKLEGYLFPDTYDMYIGESASSIIKRFLENFNEKWTSDYDQRAKELGYTPNEILTIASIIQKEAAGASQMADISSVIHNRLNRAAVYPMLQCDSTKLYVTNHLSDLLGESKSNKYLDKYDTAVCMGLPEGPICNPGLDAIHAALYPSDTSYLYFCHDKSGKVYYATTDIEHQQNVATIS